MIIALALLSREYTVCLKSSGVSFPNLAVDFSCAKEWHTHRHDTIVIIDLRFIVVAVDFGIEGLEFWYTIPAI
jgi:hypothetical protein